MRQQRPGQTSAQADDLIVQNQTPTPGKQSRAASLSAGDAGDQAVQWRAGQGVIPSAEAVQKKADANESAGDAAGDITAADIQYEIIAHNFGYRDSLAGAPAELLQRWGYQPEWASRINDAATGFFCGLLMPDAEHPELMPVLVFRGTEGGSDMNDLISDVNPVAVGHNQFHANRGIVQQMIAEAGGRVDITGHSLGGALAQHCAAAFTGSVANVFTYQAPAIQAGAARRVAGQDDGPQTRHHLASFDLVDNAGDSHLPGEFFRHDVGGGPASHVRYLMSTPEFADQRAQLGLDDDTLAALGVDKQSTNSPVEHSEAYPDPVLGTVSEVARRAVGSVLYPIVGGISALLADDDQKIGERVSEMPAAQLASEPVSQRAYLISRLCRGITPNDDERAVLSVLNASTADAPAVIEVVGAHEIASSLHGKEFDALMAYYRQHYFPRAGQGKLLELITQCMDGRTSEWEEQIIADILVFRPDGRAIITRIGAHYSGGGFAEGLNKVKWQLDGADQRRVVARFAAR